jgi:hypothetical protein
MEAAPKEREMAIPTISPSQYTSFVHCRQAWYFGYLADCSRIWPDKNYGGMYGIQLKPKHLPLPIKLGAIWDRFQNAWYAGERFKPANLMSYCDYYDLGDYDVCKLSALCKAWYKMDWDIDREGAITQSEFHVPSLGFIFHGILDVLYLDYIVENKLSGSPRRFESIFNFHDQAAVYLLAHPDASHLIIRAVQIPMLRPKREEPSMEFRDRVYSDIISRPSHYFIGFDRKAGTFGIKFWRSEFDIDGLVADFEHVHADMERCRADKSLCYQDKLSCYVPAQCMYLPICRDGGVSDELYEPRQNRKEVRKDEDSI